MHDSPFFVIFAIIVVALILLAFVAIVASWKTPGKASQRPSRGGYRPLPPGQGRRPHPNPPKAPKGSGGGSH